jgi:lipid-binding SYLF domain-containing protein
MLRNLAVATLALLAITIRPAAAQSEQQVLVDRATLAVEELTSGDNSADPKRMLRKARAAMVCPRIFRASFFVGGSGGGCVLVARDGSGSWSYPAFYGMASGSLGLQFGIQDSEFMMLILTEKGLGAVLDSQFKIGGDANIAIADMGAGVEGSTTSAVGADIVAFSKTRGLFAGAALQGSLMSVKSDWNRMYYGQDLSARQIVLSMQGRNQGADPLREVLTRSADSQVGLPTHAAESLPPLPPAQTAAPGPRGPVQQQNLAPPPQTLQLPANRQ